MGMITKYEIKNFPCRQWGWLQNMKSLNPTCDDQCLDYDPGTNKSSNVASGMS